MDRAALRHTRSATTRRSIFAFVILQALMLAVAFAAPLSQNAGSAHVTLTALPDPPRAGSNDFIVQVTGAPSAALDRTTVRFSTLMPTMNMTGPAGDARRIGNNSWRFTAMLGMAAPWAVRVTLSGGINGTATFDYKVGTQNAPMQHMANAPQSAAMNSMSGMSMASGGDPNAWRNATFALIALIVIGALVLWRNRRPSAIAIVIVAALVILGIAYAQSRSGSPPMDMSSMQSAPGSAAVPVTLATVGGDPGGSTISAPANVQPYFMQNIVSRAPGLLSDFNAYTGDRLNAGDVVAHLDEPELQSNAQAARSAAQASQDNIIMAHHDAMIADADLAAKQQQLAYWKAEIAREKSLLDQGAVSVEEYQNEKAQAAAAQSDYDAARAKFAGANVGIQAARAQASQAASNAQALNVTAGYTNVVVPDDAIVMKRLVDPGVYVQAGTPILQVAVVNRLRVQAQVSQQDLAGVHVGTPIDVSFSDGSVLHSHVSSVSPVVDPNTHTAIAEAIVSNPGDRYQPGAFVHTILRTQSIARNNAFAVPSGAIMGGATTAVWVDADGTAHRIPVTVVSDDGTNAQVTGDLRPGMRVVVTGAENLEEGQAIAESGP